MEFIQACFFYRLLVFFNALHCEYCVCVMCNLLFGFRARGGVFDIKVKDDYSWCGDVQMLHVMCVHIHDCLVPQRHVFNAMIELFTVSYCLEVDVMVGDFNNLAACSFGQENQEALGKPLFCSLFNSSEIFSRLLLEHVIAENNVGGGTQSVSFQRCIEVVPFVQNLNQSAAITGETSSSEKALVTRAHTNFPDCSTDTGLGSEAESRVSYSSTKTVSPKTPVLAAAAGNLPDPSTETHSSTDTSWVTDALCCVVFSWRHVYSRLRNLNASGVLRVDQDIVSFYPTGISPDWEIRLSFSSLKLSRSGSHWCIHDNDYHSLMHINMDTSTSSQADAAPETKATWFLPGANRSNTLSPCIPSNTYVEFLRARPSCEREQLVCQPSPEHFRCHPLSRLLERNTGRYAGVPYFLLQETQDLLCKYEASAYTAWRNICTGISSELCRLSESESVLEEVTGGLFEPKESFVSLPRMYIQTTHPLCGLAEISGYRFEPNVHKSTYAKFKDICKANGLFKPDAATPITDTFAHSLECWDIRMYDFSKESYLVMMESLRSLLGCIDFSGNASTKTSVRCDVCVVRLAQSTFLNQNSFLRSVFPKDDVREAYEASLMLLIVSRESGWPVLVVVPRRECMAAYIANYYDSVDIGIIELSLPGWRMKNGTPPEGRLLRGGVTTLSVGYVFSSLQDDIRQDFLLDCMIHEVDVIVGLTPQIACKLQVYFNFYQCELYRYFQAQLRNGDSFIHVLHYLPGYFFVPGACVLSWGHNSRTSRFFMHECFARAPGMWRFATQKRYLRRGHRVVFLDLVQCKSHETEANSANLRRIAWHIGTLDFLRQIQSESIPIPSVLHSSKRQAHRFDALPASSLGHWIKPLCIMSVEDV